MSSTLSTLRSSAYGTRGSFLKPTSSPLTSPLKRLQGFSRLISQSRSSLLCLTGLHTPFWLPAPLFSALTVLGFDASYTPPVLCLGPSSLPSSIPPVPSLLLNSSCIINSLLSDSQCGHSRLYGIPSQLYQPSYPHSEGLTPLLPAARSY